MVVHYHLPSDTWEFVYPTDCSIFTAPSLSRIWWPIYLNSLTPSPRVNDHHIHTPSHTHFPLSISANMGFFSKPHLLSFSCPAHVVFLLCVPCFYKWRLLLSPTATPWWWAGHCHVRRLCYAHPFTLLLVNNLLSFLKIFIFPPFCWHFIMLEWFCTLTAWDELYSQQQTLRDCEVRHL